MLANTILLIFIPVALIIRVLPMRIRPMILLLAGCIFYALCDYRYLALVILEVLISFWIGKELFKNKSKLLVATGVVISISFWGFFKAIGIFSNYQVGALKLLMPIGISYYSFKIIGYYVDIYRGKIDSPLQLLEYSNYIIFFPQMICGPIGRTPKFIEQYRNWKDRVDIPLADGIILILSGMFKKYVIADRLVTYIDAVYGDYSSFPTLALWMGAFFYTIQIYCDFAGYSEIAIGISRLMGIETENNFNLPYLAYSIKDFWRRWHISLSTWFRDYVYISVGGSRCGKIRKCFNILLTFLVSGLWHGNGCQFIIWGLYHGLINLIPVKEAKNQLVKVLQCVFTFILVAIGWVMFRSATMADGFKYIGKMFTGISLNMFEYNAIVSSVMPFTNDYSCVAVFLTVMIMIVLLFVMELREYKGHKIKDVVKVPIYVATLILFGIVGSNSFLYANF